MVEFEEELKEAERFLVEGEALKAAEKYIQVAQRLDAQGDYLAAAQTFLKAAEIYRGRGECYGAASAFKDAMIRFLVAGRLDEALRVAETVKEEEIRSSPTFAFTLIMLEERKKELEEKGAAEAPRLEEAEPLSKEDAGKAVGTERWVRSRSVRVKGEVDEATLGGVFAKMRRTIDRRVTFKLTGKSGGKRVEGYVGCELTLTDPPYYVAEVELGGLWEGGLEDASLEGLVPEGFEVVDAEGGSVEEADGGTRVTFKVGRLAEGEKARFRVKAARSVARTVVFRRGNLLDVVRTYLPVRGENGKLIVSSEILGIAGGVNDVFLEDEIPLELAIVGMFPEGGEVRLVEGEETLVRWRLK
ncbi:MAG: hypothetical protein KIH01_07465, partial [Candidatus Freyarchaeota archaeon]|nr:hypothetical protein [Candidatus Jordarchaeia archaeon]